MAAANTADLEHAYHIVQRLYSGQSPPDEQQDLQRQLFDLQKRVEAWSVIVPFLQHDDPNVQFFGAHTAQVKIARDWETLPESDMDRFRDSMLHLAGFAAAQSRSKVVLRKLYVALVSLALRLCAYTPTRWPDWVLSSSTTLTALGMPPEGTLDYLAIVAEEASRSDLVGSSRLQLSISMRDAIPVVSRAVITSLEDPLRPWSEKNSALKCLESWIQHLPSNDITATIPLLITTLSHSDLFVPTSDVLVEILSSSPLSGGSGTKMLTEPILTWLEQRGKLIYASSREEQSIDDVSRGLCKLLVALGDHSVTFVASNLLDSRVQTFLSTLMGYSGFPGWYGTDEEESDMTISFWTYLGEAILDADFTSDAKGAQMTIAKQVFTELVGTLQIKCRWPPYPDLHSWSKDQIERFSSYRRDLGEAVINAYYIIRDDVLKLLVNPVVRATESSDPSAVDWEDVEASLHCIKSAQDAVPLQDNLYLSELLATFDRLPISGHIRVRQTALGLIGEYSTWFTSQKTPILLRALTYVVISLREGSLTFYAASALKELCDANRTQLAPHIASFSELHSALSTIPASERAKVVESIASVIQALPPQEGALPAEAVVRPILDGLQSSLESAAEQPIESRDLIELHLSTLAACAKGLSSTTDAFQYEDLSGPEGTAQMQAMEHGRSIPALSRTRDRALSLLGQTMNTWSHDPGIADVLSELIKQITALPSEASLISLPPAPLLELICIAADRQLTSVWLTLAGRLVVQLEPPSFVSLKPEPGGEVRRLVDQVTQSLIVSSLRVLGQPGAMEANPDLVQAFFACLDTITITFSRAVVVLPPELSSAVLQCTTRALTLQERYSLVGSCKFLATFVKRSMSDESSADSARLLLQHHGQHFVVALVLGIAGGAPRSAVPNLATVLATLVSKLPAESRVWLQQAMLLEPLAANTKINQAAKDNFVKLIIGSRSTQKTVNAANDLALIGRGLNGTSYAAGQTL